MNLLEKIILKIIKHKLVNLFNLEKSLSKETKNVYKHNEISPAKNWPDLEKVTSGNEIPFSLKNIATVGHHLKSCVSQGIMSIESVRKNPKESKTHISTEELKEFEKSAKSIGIEVVGYTILPNDLIFKERALLFNHAIVLIMEMNREKILKAPSKETFKMVMETYDKLGTITNKLSSKLQQMGFKSQASHPLGGLVLYPPLAVRAGLGYYGTHGLLITPEFGPRQRISAIFTNIENLPINKENNHLWVSDFCAKCKICVKTCPSNAIYDSPLETTPIRKTCINREKCLPVFVKENGCSVCIKNCMFTQKTYSELYKTHKNNQQINYIL